MTGRANKARPGQWRRGRHTGSCLWLVSLLSKHYTLYSGQTKETQGSLCCSAAFCYSGDVLTSVHIFQAVKSHCVLHVLRSQSTGCYLGYRLRCTMKLNIIKSQAIELILALTWLNVPQHCYFWSVHIVQTLSEVINIYMILFDNS